MIKLTIIDSGDPSVGIFPTSWTIDCPFDETADKDERGWFIQLISPIYREYAEGNLSFHYSDEQ